MHHSGNAREFPRLVLHEKWSKALSPEDRAIILEKYLTRIEQKLNGVFYVPIKITRNYRNALLVTIFIENRSESTWYLNRIINCKAEDKLIGSSLFNEPSVVVKPFTIMPWTLIYEKEQHTVQYRRIPSFY